ncbi:hypothetical protein TNCV_1900061 [Trichonephila clavipes]|nr:hypothetical protein TNCV_1900061 [Trichonephila clavipes]
MYSYLERTRDRHRPSNIFEMDHYVRGGRRRFNDWNGLLCSLTHVSDDVLIEHAWDVLVRSTAARISASMSS